MTVGELARLFNAERKIGADLTVDPLRGLAAGRPLRPDGPALGQPVAQHAEPDRGPALSRASACWRRPTWRPAGGPTRRSSASAPPGSTRRVRRGAERAGAAGRPVRARSGSPPRSGSTPAQECGGVQILDHRLVGVRAGRPGIGLARTSPHRSTPTSGSRPASSRCSPTATRIRRSSAARDRRSGRPGRTNWQFRQIRAKYLLYQ